MKHGKKKRGGNAKLLVMRIAIVNIVERISCGSLWEIQMARANRAYTGSRTSVGQPTLSRNSYMQLMRQIRKARDQKNAEAEREKTKL